MIKRFSSWIIVTGLGFFWLAAGASAQQPFYKGKTVRIIVGGSAGGGYDTYTRTIARHLSKHVPGNPTFYRVAVTRRTRGWIHQAALTVPARPGEGERILGLIESATDSLERIALCKLFLEHLGRSRLAPRVLLALAQEADRAATSLSRRARKRLAKLNEDNTRDYYLNDSSLDRYSKLRIKFDFNRSTTEYVYDGQAYREIIRRFPASPEAKRARQRLDRTEQKLARQQD